MIQSFKSKALAEVWSTGKSAKVNVKLLPRILIRLDRLDAAKSPDDMNLPGYDFHALRGHKPRRYTVHINGPWCITFEFEGIDAVRVDLEQYH